MPRWTSAGKQIIQLIELLRIQLSPVALTVRQLGFVMMEPHGVVTQSGQPISQLVCLLVGEVCRETEVHTIEPLWSARLVVEGKGPVTVCAANRACPQASPAAVTWEKSGAEPVSISSCIVAESSLSPATIVNGASCSTLTPPVADHREVEVDLEVLAKRLLAAGHAGCGRRRLVPTSGCPGSEWGRLWKEKLQRRTAWHLDCQSAHGSVEESGLTEVGRKLSRPLIRFPVAARQCRDRELGADVQRIEYHVLLGNERVAGLHDPFWPSLSPAPGSPLPRR